MTKILRELALFANHRSNTKNEIYKFVLGHIILTDPRILIGFCLRNGLDYIF